MPAQARCQVLCSLATVCAVISCAAAQTCGEVDSCEAGGDCASRELLAGRGWHPSMPPIGVGLDYLEASRWFQANTPKLLPPPAGRTAREADMLRWTAADFVAQRRAGAVTCEEYVRALAAQVVHYREYNAFCHWGTYSNWTDAVIAQAMKLDALAASQGVDALAPLYCLPIPAKDTLATASFPSAAGAMHFAGRYAVKNAHIVDRIEAMRGLILGKTNTPVFAYSYTTCSAECGCAVNAYAPGLHTCGSSGGSAVAVSLHAAPIALTEDTGGSTRCPAANNGNFGYDPYQNKFNYPSDGNIGITFVNDQLGINARALDDVLWWDQITGDLVKEHTAASRKVARQGMSEIRIGLPMEYLVEHCVHGDGDTFFGSPKCTDLMRRPASNIMAKYHAVKAALQKAGVTLVLQDWPKRKPSDEMNYLEYAYNHPPRATDTSLLPPAEAFFSMRMEIMNFANTYLGIASSANKLVEDDLMVQLAGGPEEAKHPFPFSFQDSLSLTGFRHVSQVWVPKVAIPAWNSYFDAHDLDMILAPAGFCGAYTYSDMANGTTQLGVSYDGGSTWEDTAATQMDCNFVSFFTAKQFPVSKLMFPVGRDDRNGGTIGMQFYSRSGPPGADPMEVPTMGKRKENTWDIEFLHKVKRVLDAMYDIDPSLQRFDAPHLGL